MLKAYEEYQKSELPWVNEIPSHWMWLRNGFLLVNHKERVGDRFSDFQLLSLTTKGIKEKNIEDASGKVPDSYEGYQSFSLFEVPVQKQADHNMKKPSSLFLLHRME